MTDQIPPTEVGGSFNSSLTTKFEMEGINPMYLEPIVNLNWAYQLHYYICFRTHRRKKHFASIDRVEALSHELNQICERHLFHLLKAKIYPDHLRCILSLKPSDSISKTLQSLKTNLSRELGPPIQAPIWANGFLARSTGRVRIDTVKNYIDMQSEHHGYEKRIHPTIFRFITKAPTTLSANHSVFDLKHHVVLVTKYRRAIFGSRIANNILEYWKQVAIKKQFAIDRASVLPDHIHLIVRIVPKLSIEYSVLALMNNGQYWISRNHPELLVKEGINQLWQPSAYVGTCGQMTTALLKKFLCSAEKGIEVSAQFRGRY